MSETISEEATVEKHKLYKLEGETKENVYTLFALCRCLEPSVRDDAVRTAAAHLNAAIEECKRLLGIE